MKSTHDTNSKSVPGRKSANSSFKVTEVAKSKKTKSHQKRKSVNSFQVTEIVKGDKTEEIIKPIVKKKNKVKQPVKDLIINDNEDLDYFQVKNKEEDFNFDINEGSESNDDEEENYENFMEALASIDGKKKKVAVSRTEGTGDVGEFNLSSRKSDKVNASELLDAVRDKSDVRKLAKRLKTQSKPEAALPIPLEKPAAERVERLTGYTKAKRDVAVWDAVVHSRRAADTVSFPLVKPDLRLQTAEQIVKTRFTPETPLEQQVAALLAGSKSVVQSGEELSEIEKKGLENLTAEEAAERRAELAKVRALQSYQDAKYRRQNKIKSKKFRKIARKEKEKQKIKELEELERTDPSAAAEKLAEMEKTRIEERASLKHRNASKHLQFQAKRAKYDKESKAVVQDQLRLHRELTAKTKEVSESENEEEVEEDDEDVNVVVEGGKREETMDEFVSGYKKFWNDEQKKRQDAAVEENDNIDDMFADAEVKLRQSVRGKINEMKAGVDGKECEDQHEEEEDDGIQADSLNFKVRPNEETTKSSESQKQVKTKEVRVDPENYVSIEPKKLSSDHPDMVGYNEEDSENEDEQRKAIAEAFADDDVVADFTSEKAAIVDANKPKDIDLTLPGWGDWGGGGLKVSKRKRKRFIIKAPPAPKRNDENKGHLILNTDKDVKIKAHQVSNVPFPFTSVSDWEASIRAPVGAAFLPPSAFKKMIQPKVKTQMGAVIEPMDKTQLVKRGIKVKGTENL